MIAFAACIFYDSSSFMSYSMLFSVAAVFSFVELGSLQAERRSQQATQLRELTIFR
jgi:hypothetical protein